MEKGKQFKPFRETYRIITFNMSVGMIYPHPKTDMWRLAAIPLLILSTSPLVAIVFIDMYYSWLRRDVLNIIRHCIVAGPFFAGYLKMILIYHKRAEAKRILDDIDCDYESYNHLPEDYRQIVADSIRYNLVYCERTWALVVTTCVMIFPVMAIVLNIYNYTFKDEPVKYMVHDLNKPFSEPADRFDSPYFEFIFVYMFYVCILYTFNYIGFDGFFGLSISHACLKMELYCKALEDAFAGPPSEIPQKIISVIIEQNRTFEFINCLQDTFNNWLGLIFLATMIQISNCMYHTTEGFDLRYTMFLTGATIHVFLPCRYVSNLKAMASETGTRFYSCGWENVRSQSVRKMILFMIARAQVPIEITAFKMVSFDMELFVSIMQSAYSMYTLLSS